MTLHRSAARPETVTRLLRPRAGAPATGVFLAALVLSAAAAPFVETASAGAPERAAAASGAVAAMASDGRAGRTTGAVAPAGRVATSGGSGSGDPTGPAPTIPHRPD